MSTSALSTRGLDKSFGSLVVASDIELDLPPGERYALIGPNGAGKTTLINLITGMVKPDKGQIFLGADEITMLRPEERVKCGLVGAIIYMVARDQFSGINPQYWYFWIGTLLIAVVIFLPNGILGGAARLVRFFERSRA